MKCLISKNNIHYPKKRTLCRIIWLHFWRWYGNNMKNRRAASWELSAKTDLRACPAVSIAGPQQSDQVEAKESTQQCQHHIVLSHSGKQLCCTRYVHVIRHHKEGAPKESEMVTQTLHSLRSGFLSHLRQTQRNHNLRQLLVQLEHYIHADPRENRLYSGGNSLGILQCSMIRSLCPSTNTCS